MCVYIYIYIYVYIYVWVCFITKHFTQYLLYLQHKSVETWILLSVLCCKKMRSHFNFGVLIVLPQGVLSAAAGEGWKWG